MVLPAVLRDPARHPDKLGGVLAMFGSIAVLFVLPWLDTSRVRSCTFRPIYKWFMMFLVVDVIVLGICGSKPPEGFWVPLSQLATLYYFAHFLVLLPILGKIERPLPLPPQHRRLGAQEEGGLRAMRKPFARNLLVSGAIALAAFATGTVAIAAGGTEHPPHKHWHFQGPFGTFDRAAAQRGFQVYQEVCAACHSLSLMSYRNLTDLGLTENQVKGLIKDITVSDLNDDGAPVDRPARPSDRFKKPFPNEAAAAAANNGKAPPDLSVIVKAREFGPDYIYGILTGYVPYDKLTPEQIKEFDVKPDDNFNKYFPGHKIAMAPAAGRRQGDLCRRHEGHARSGSRRRHRVSGVGLRAAHGRPQAHRRSRHPVPDRAGGHDVRREAHGVGRQALIKGARHCERSNLCS
jgi:cytochrome c1